MAPLLKASILLITIYMATAFEAGTKYKVLHIPEKIIGGVIDMVQSHKNKPTQQVTLQQNQQVQQVYQQGYPQYPYQPWNSGVQTSQSQAQAQYANYYQPSNQGSYVSSPQGSSGSFEASQTQNQVYPQGGQFQNQNQGNFDQSGQFQNGPYPNGNQQSGHYQNTGQQHFVGQQPAGFVNQNQPGFVGPSHSNTGFVGQNQQTSGFVNQQNFAGQQPGFGTSQGAVSSGSYGSPGQQQASQFQSHGSNGQNGGFQFSSNNSVRPGPTCVCQAWTKPLNEERSEPLAENTTVKMEESEKAV